MLSNLEQLLFWRENKVLILAGKKHSFWRQNEEEYELIIVKLIFV